MTRTDGARTVPRKLAERVAVVAQAGLGRWDGARELVEAPSVAFLDALHRWERAVDPPPELDIGGIMSYDNPLSTIADLGLAAARDRKPLPTTQPRRAEPAHVCR